MERRDFIKAGLATAGGLVVGDGFWRALFAAPANDAPHSSYGALSDPDGLGLQHPGGFSARVVAQSGQPVPGASGLPVGDLGHLYPAFPDGAATFPADDGGWVLVVNSENPLPADFPLLPEVQDLLGGASALRFDAQGNVVDAYWVLRGTRCNCAGGVTPWGTWLSCEEFDFTVRSPFSAPSEAGRVFECDPFDRGSANARVHEALGRSSTRRPHSTTRAGST